MDGETTTGGPLVVLAVCTGNLCRSPLVERLLAARLADDGVPAVVTSAGTAAVPGLDVPAETFRLIAAGGGADAPHEPRRLDAAMLADADLVLTATRAHRRAVVELAPAVVARSFVLEEAARLAEHAVADGAAAAAPDGLAAVLGRYRDAEPPSADADDLPDPYRRDAAVWAEAGARIDGATRSLGRSLAALLRRG